VDFHEITPSLLFSLLPIGAHGAQEPPDARRHYAAEPLSQRYFASFIASAADYSFSLIFFDADIIFACHC
jgi:hypothetical protein